MSREVRGVALFEGFMLDNLTKQSRYEKKKKKYNKI